MPLQWRHNGRDGVSNHQALHCLLNRLYGRRSRKTSKLRVTGLCVGNSPGAAEFPAQMANNAEIVWWRHHDAKMPYLIPKGPQLHQINHGSYPMSSCIAVPMTALITRFMGQHGAHLGPTGSRRDPCWTHGLCYLGDVNIFTKLQVLLVMHWPWQADIRVNLHRFQVTRWD